MINTIDEVEVDLILSLYEKYKLELVEVTKKAKEFKQGKVCMLPFRTTELLYLLVRHYKPETIVEFSPHEGWSTFWITEALEKNNFGKIKSFDLIPNTSYNLKDKIDKGFLDFKLGDVTQQLTNEDIENCSFFYIDSDHSEPFANWYIEKILNKKINKNCIVLIDDIFHEPMGYLNNGESKRVYEWMLNNSIKFVNFSKYRFNGNWEKLQKLVLDLHTGREADVDGIITTIYFKL